MNTTLVVNAKGGVGKTTITTNLASYFAARDIPTTIADFDPQGSSLNWLAQRSSDARNIHGADLSTRHGTGLQSGRRQIPRDTQQLIIDAPAGPSRLLLQDLLARTQSILIPVAPSSIDVHATANFIKELLLVGHVRFRNIRVAVVANRVRSGKPVYAPLERFVSSLGIAFLGRVSDSDVYVEAAETGLGIFDLPADTCCAELREFQPIVRWVSGDDQVADTAISNVVPINAARA
ncbi:MAG TPA: ParA family protein [Gammaproteobacteria bacterium]|nr:ParA family protein [Gammaproteobacteria bacterium]